jgi:hypothetical protein
MRLTHSDSPYIHHGVGDWMIRGLLLVLFNNSDAVLEEILEQSIFWSKSGRYIAYSSYDTRNTSKVTLTFESKWA